MWLLRRFNYDFKCEEYLRFGPRVEFTLHLDKAGAFASFEDAHAALLKFPAGSVGIVEADDVRRAMRITPESR